MNLVGELKKLCDIKVTIIPMIKKNNSGGARGVMVIGVGNGHGDMSSNPGRD